MRKTGISWKVLRNHYGLRRTRPRVLWKSALMPETSADERDLAHSWLAKTD